MNFSAIHNYYERLVIDEVMNSVAKERGITEQDTLEDLVCLALNQLPARYVRHDVDMAFYLTLQEREAMEQAVRHAVAYALDHLNSRDLA